MGVLDNVCGGAVVLWFTCTAVALSMGRKITAIMGYAWNTERGCKFQNVFSFFLAMIYSNNRSPV